MAERERIGLEVRDILKSEGIASILVTHDQDEAFVLGDVIGVMNQGKVIQWDTPFNIYHEPINRFVAHFIGQGVLIPGNVHSERSVSTEIGVITGNRSYNWGGNDEIDILIRPDDIVHDAEGPFSAEVRHRAFKGASILYTLKLESGQELLALFPSHFHYPIGERLRFRVEADHVIAFPRKVS